MEKHEKSWATGKNMMFQRISDNHVFLKPKKNMNQYEPSTYRDFAVDVRFVGVNHDLYTPYTAQT